MVALLFLAGAYRWNLPGREPGMSTGSEKYFELSDAEESYLISMDKIASAHAIDPRCPPAPLAALDRVTLSEQGCQVDRGNASNFARLAAGSKMSLNRATAQDFEVISGVGAKRAEKIIELREELGGFKSLDDLGHFKWFKGPLRQETERYFKIED